MIDEKKVSDKYSDDFSVSEDIEEDLDSFLNSSHSNQDDFTKEYHQTVFDLFFLEPFFQFRPI